MMNDQPMSQLATLAFRLNRAFTQCLVTTAERFDHHMNGQELKTLFFIGKLKRPIMRVLAEEMHLALSTMTGIVDTLVTKGLTMREWDVSDRRKVFISLTVEGEILFGRLQDGLAAMDQSLLEDLNFMEKDLLFTLAGKVHPN